MATIVLRLRRLRERAGLSQGELADRAGTTQTTVSNMELGKGRRVDLDIIERLAKALGVAPLELLDDGGRGRAIRRRRA